MNYEVINKQAKLDNFTKDKMYNNGLKIIREHGIEHCYYKDEVNTGLYVMVFQSLNKI